MKDLAGVSAPPRSPRSPPPVMWAAGASFDFRAALVADAAVGAVRRSSSPPRGDAGLRTPGPRGLLVRLLWSTGPVPPTPPLSLVLPSPVTRALTAVCSSAADTSAAVPGAAADEETRPRRAGEAPRDFLPCPSEPSPLLTSGMSDGARIEPKDLGEAPRDLLTLPSDEARAELKDLRAAASTGRPGAGEPPARSLGTESRRGRMAGDAGRPGLQGALLSAALRGCGGGEAGRCVRGALARRAACAPDPDVCAVAEAASEDAEASASS